MSTTSIRPVDSSPHAAFGHERPVTDAARGAPGAMVPRAPRRRPTPGRGREGRAVPALVLGAKLAGFAIGDGACVGPAAVPGPRSGEGARCGGRGVDADLVGDPHVLRVEDELAVEPCVGDGGQPIELEAPGTQGWPPGSLEAAPVPPARSRRADLDRRPPTPPAELPDAAAAWSRAPIAGIHDKSSRKHRATSTPESGSFQRHSHVRSSQDVVSNRPAGAASHGAI